MTGGAPSRCSLRRLENFSSFCELLGNPDWTREEKCSNHLGRKRDEDELNARVEEWTQNHTAEDVMQRLQSAGVAAGVVSTGEDLNKNPQLGARGHYKVLNHTEIGSVPFANPPYRFARTPHDVRTPAPCFGGHTQYVWREKLKIS